MLHKTVKLYSIEGEYDFNGDFFEGYEVDVFDSNGKLVFVETGWCQSLENYLITIEKDILNSHGNWFSILKSYNDEQLLENHNEDLVDDKQLNERVCNSLKKVARTAYPDLEGVDDFELKLMKNSSDIYGKGNYIPDAKLLFIFNSDGKDVEYLIAVGLEQLASHIMSIKHGVNFTNKLFYEILVKLFDIASSLTDVAFDYGKAWRKGLINNNHIHALGKERVDTLLKHYWIVNIEKVILTLNKELKMLEKTSEEVYQEKIKQIKNDLIRVVKMFHGPAVNFAEKEIAFIEKSLLVIDSEIVKLKEGSST